MAYGYFFQSRCDSDFADFGDVAQVAVSLWPESRGEPIGVTLLRELYQSARSTADAGCGSALS